MYSQYCDCGKFIHPVEPLEDDGSACSNVDEGIGNNNNNSNNNNKSRKRSQEPKFAYFITRGVEILDAEGGKIGKRKT